MKAIYFLLVACVGLLSGCTIARQVNPVPAGTAVGKIYVIENEDVQMEGLGPEIVTQLQDLGFSAELVTGSPPSGALHRLEYTANWRWDLAMYLAYFEARFIEGDVVLGTAVYDALQGGSNMGKFGNTSEKIRPLLEELLEGVRPTGATAPVMGSP